MDKILIVSHTEVFKGGSERSNIKLAQGFSDYGYKVTFLLPKLCKYDSVYDEFQLIFSKKFNFQKTKKKVSLKNIPSIFFSRLKHFFWLFSNRRKFDEYKLVILSTNRTVSELIFFKLINKKCFVINRGVDTRFKIRYLFLNFADKIFFLNKFKIKSISKFVLNSKISFYHNEINGKSYDTSELPSYNQIISIGKNSYEKGIDRFVDFIQLFNKKFIVARFGEGCKNLTKWSKEKANHEEIYSFGDIVFLTTRNEDFPRTFLESFYHKKFLICYPWPGIELFNEFKFYIVNSSEEVSNKINQISQMDNSEVKKILEFNYKLVVKYYGFSPAKLLIENYENN